MTRLFGVEDEFGEDAILGRLEGMKEVIEQVNQQFRDPVRPLVPIALLHLTFCYKVFVLLRGAYYQKLCCALTIRLTREQKLPIG